MNSFKLAAVTCLCFFILSCTKRDQKTAAAHTSACLTSNKDTAYVSENIYFFSCSQNADSVVFSFGDGTTSRDTAPIHAYSLLGSYTASIKSFDPSGIAIATKNIEVIHGLAPSAHSVYFKPGTNYDSAVFIGYDRQNFNFICWELEMGQALIAGTFVRGDTFTIYRNDGAVYNFGSGHFSPHYDTVTINYTTVPGGNPANATTGTYIGVRQ